MAFPVLTNPLSGDDALAAEIRSALAATSLAARLSAKVSITVDLDLAADVALRSIEDNVVHVSLASSPLGAVPRKQAADCVQRVLASSWPRWHPVSRMRDVLERGGIETFQVRHRRLSRRSAAAGPASRRRVDPASMTLRSASACRSAIPTPPT